MYSRMNPARLDREDEKQMLPCRFFLAGACKNGNRCKFYHPNVHTRDLFIRAPEMPAYFTTPHQYNQYTEPHEIPSLMEMSGPRASNSRSRIFSTGHSSPIRHGASTSSPRASSTGFKNFMSPQSQSYSEYLAFTQQQRNNPVAQNQNAEEERKISTEDSKSSQNTIFNHIDWSEFLTPGICPPLPTEVPCEATAISPNHQVDPNLGFSNTWRPSETDSVRIKPILKVNNEDIPPEGYQVGAKIQGDNVPAGVPTPMQSIPRKISAKEELQLKVKQIAQELAEEPVQHVRSLDSFFRNFKFNGFACPSSPSSVGTHPVNENEDDVSDGNKENTVQVVVEAEKQNETLESGVSSSTENIHELCASEDQNDDFSVMKSVSPPGPGI